MDTKGEKISNSIMYFFNLFRFESHAIFFRFPVEGQRWSLIEQKYWEKHRMRMELQSKERQEREREKWAKMDWKKKEYKLNSLGLFAAGKHMLHVTWCDAIFDEWKIYMDNVSIRIKWIRAIEVLNDIEWEESEKR